MSSYPVNIREMTLDDLDQVCLIDQLSFSLPWPKKSFYYEVADNRFSTCWVAEMGQGVEDEVRIVGMAVVWLIVDEAHIATIAVHPEFRGLGIGKRLLAVILEDSRRQGMDTATLEVRVSNQLAQAIYQNFGFEVKGVRPRYYKDNQEDALIMTADLVQTFRISETPEVSRPDTVEGEQSEF